MAQNIVKPVGATKASKPDAGGANLRSVPVFGVVKNNVDPTRTGRIQVYISDFGSDNPDDANAWSTVSYMSPFFGSVKPDAPKTGFGSYITNPSSYGFWNSPPDIDSIVVCIFINGDPNYGFYIGCVPKAESLHMVPAIGSSTNVILNNPGEAAGYGGATRLPVTNINTNNPSISNGANFLNEPKPVHSYSAAVFNQQGLIRDPIRGPISSSAQRESPSRVGWGISTPGRPIYEGGFTDDTIVKAATDKKTPPSSMRVISRRGGHSIVLDDGDIIGQDQLVRIRSAGGHQILMSDDGQTLFIVHSNGQSYIELGKEGTIDMFSTNSVNVRTQGEINLHSDNDININTKKKLNIQADSIHVNSDKEMTHKVGAAYTVHTVGNHTHKIDGSIALAAAGTAGFSANDRLNVLGSSINLNSGGLALTPTAVIPKSLIAQTDTLFSPSTGFSAAPGALQTIVSRAPAHSPWANANQGVAVKTTTNASASLPAAPPPAVAATNVTAAASPPIQPVTAAVVASVPATTAVSAAIPATATAALVGASATNAATGPLATAVATGSGIVPTANGLVAAVGVFAQSPAQLEAAGICKPGSSALITSLVQGGANLSTAFSSSMFVGGLGPKNLESFIQDIPKQISSQITNFQQAQTALTGAAVITGNESAGSIAGLVLAAASNGAEATVGAIKTMSGGLSPTITGLSGEVDAIVNSISSGNFAAKLAETTASGITAISGAVENASGPISAAFDAIKSSFKKLEVGVPQNLKAIVESNPPLTDLPGAANSISASANSIAKLPGASTINSLINETATGATNNISVQQSIDSSLASASNDITAGLEKLKAGIGRLQTNVSIATSPENTAKISSAIAALAASMPSSIKMPTIGIDSNDRSEISSQITSVLGNIKIPKPNFGTGASESAKSAVEISQQLQEAVIEAAEKAKEASSLVQIQINAAKKKFDELQNTLVQGSPEIDAAKKAWFELLGKQKSIIDVLDKITIE